MQYIIAIFLFCIIVIFHEFGHFLLAKLNKVGVKEFACGFGPKIISKKIGETTYSIRALPLGGFCSMVGEDEIVEDEKLLKKSFSSKKVWQKFLIVVCGPIFNFILAFVCAIIYITMVGSPDPAQINMVYENTPAYESGIQVGDVIVSINGRQMDSTADVQFYNATHGGKTYNLVIDRNGELQNITLNPAMDEQTNSYYMGISLSNTVTKDGRNVFNILEYSYYEVRYWTRVVFDSLSMLFTGSASVKEMSGVIGIVEVVGDNVQESVNYGFVTTIATCLSIIVFLSTNLGVMNLLPIPALDGGRCVIYIIEAITGKKIPAKIENAINAIGFILLMGLMVFVCANDIFKLFTR